MKYTDAALLALAGWAAATNTCTGTGYQENGNWFCSKVTKIKYDTMSRSGTFKDVTSMGSNGVCSTRDLGYSGNLAPFDEGLSVHIRGPFNLKEFAVYNPAGTGTTKRDEHDHSRRHGHQHANDQMREKRASDWTRNSYYNSETQVAQNTVFLGNYGGIGSGVWDGTWGNSLAYLSADSSTGSATSQILKNVQIPSNKEFSIWSARKCGSDCGYSRASDLAYRGFEGGTKAFIFKFNMPLDGNTGFNGNMPALWLLNAKIPRSQQYGACNCWASGCGEADIYEVLASGDVKCKSTFHMLNGLGSSDYFERPTGGVIKVAAVFHAASQTITILRLADNFNFGTSITDAIIQEWIK